MSTLNVACPHCQAKIKVPQDRLGQQIQCPKCKQALRLESAPPARQGADPFALGDEDRPVRDRGQPSAFWEFLTFRRMIAPVVLQVIFWLGVVGIIVMGLITVFGGLMLMGEKYSGAMMGGLATIVVGLLYTLLGPFVLRLYFELLMMIFRIYDVLREIRDKLDHR